MKIIRWLLSHTFLILLIVAVIYGYMFWGNLAGEDTPVGKAVSYLSDEFVVVAEFVDAVKDKQAKVNQEESSEGQASEKRSSEEQALTQQDSASDEPIGDTGYSAESGDQRGSQITAQSSAPVVENTVEMALEPAQEVVAEQSVTDVQTGNDNVAAGNRSEQQQAVTISSGYNDGQVTLNSADAVVSDTPVIQQDSVSADKTVQAASVGSAVSQISNESQPVPQVNTGASETFVSDELEKQLSNVDQQGQAVKAVQLDNNSVQAASVGSAVSQISNESQPVPQVNTGASETFVSDELEKQLSNADQQGQAVKAVQLDNNSVKEAGLDNDTVKEVPLGSDVRESWKTARKSFYQRNYELSEKSYQNVIDNTENNFDAYGELGNVYFNQGKKQQAANAYFEAAAILVRKGQVNRVRSLMGLLRNLDKSKADELKKLIDSSSPGSIK